MIKIMETKNKIKIFLVSDSLYTEMLPFVSRQRPGVLLVQFKFGVCKYELGDRGCLRQSLGVLLESS